MTQMYKFSLVMATALQVSDSIELMIYSFLKDCSKLELSLRQVSVGPSYKMSSNMTRPATDKALSVTLVSHIWLSYQQQNNYKLISKVCKM